jgi:putative N6-adenine-specific DNA methylase
MTCPKIVLTFAAMKIVVRTFAGLEPLLEQELIAYGGENIKVKRRAIELEGNQTLLYKINMFSRYALDVLRPVFYMKIHTTDQLYEQVKMMNWSKYIRPNQTFVITTIIHSDFFDHSQFAMLRCKDGIVDHFKEKFDKRPNIDKDNPDVHIVLRISNDHGEILLNSSGNALFKRGYRKSTGEAPLNEVLAAGIITLSGWDKTRPFIDPMCGSGTLPIEAALIANNIAPCLIREQYGFQKWADYDEETYHDLLEIARHKITPSKAVIKGLDKDESVLKKAIDNLPKIEGVKWNVSFEKADFFETKKTFDNGILVFNPPYDKRIGLLNAEDFYDKIGSTLKHGYDGYDAWLFTANLSAAKKIGLRPSRKIELYNGPDEARLFHYALYKGTKIAH